MISHPQDRVSARDDQLSLFPYGHYKQIAREIDLFEGLIEVFRVANGDLDALVHVGPPNPREFADVVSTPEKLAPMLVASGGTAIRLGADAADIPRILPVRPGAQAAGNGWIGFQNNQASVLKGINRISLFSGLIGLALLLFAFVAMWTREGR